MSADSVLSSDRPVAQVVEAPAQLGRALRVELAQEVARAVGLVVVISAGPWPAKRARSPRARAAVRAGRARRRGTESTFDQSTPPAIASASDAASTTRSCASTAAAAGERGGEQRGRGHRQRFAADPGRAERRRTRAQPTTPVRDVRAAAPRRAPPCPPEPADAPRRSRPRSGHVGRERWSGRTRKSPTGQTPNELPGAERPDQVAEVRLACRRRRCAAASRPRRRAPAARAPPSAADEPARAREQRRVGRRSTTTAAASSGGASQTAPGRLRTQTSAAQPRPRAVAHAPRARACRASTAAALRSARAAAPPTSSLIPPQSA